ncbi:hypothetical protein PV328_008171 [Microctonus aethiopoides]|uniref:Uncharacterized protein n=1 Tax=Microctonus aethiopoides TaxID=144406 RepID=A0AA39CAH0_9HYME|nr:hypothetical protein PV328_008171 [Microctonus aethiopoides]
MGKDSKEKYFALAREVDAEHKRKYPDVARAGEREANEMSGKLPTTSSSSSSLSLSLLLSSSLSHTRCRDIAKVKCPLLSASSSSSSSYKYCSCCYYCTIRILRGLIQADYYSICYHPECFQDGVELIDEKEKGDKDDNDDDDDEDDEDEDDDDDDVVIDHWRHQSIMW